MDWILSPLARLVALPALAAVPLALLPRLRRFRLYLLGVALLELALGLPVFWSVWGQGGRTVVRQLAGDGTILPWIPTLGIDLDLALDGLSAPFVLLVLLLVPCIVLARWKELEERPPVFGALALWVVAAVLLTLLARDLFLFYCGWQLLVVPLFFLLGAWGGGLRIRTAARWAIFATATSLPMLLAILEMARRHGEAAGGWSFGIDAFLALELPPDVQSWLFGAFALALLARLPLPPFHGWLVQLCDQSRASVSALVSGTVLPLGAYGLLRFAWPLFPDAASRAAPLLALLALSGILFGALVAWVQRDLRRMIAHAAAFQAGWIVLGLVAATPAARDGALALALSQGLATSILLLLVGSLADRGPWRPRTTAMSALGEAPRWRMVGLLAVLAAIGFPGTLGFAGGLLVLVGTFGSQLPRMGEVAIAASVGVLVMGLWSLRMLGGAPESDEPVEAIPPLPDLGAREMVAFLAPLLLLYLLGFAPEALLGPTRGSASPPASSAAAGASGPLAPGGAP